MEQDLIHLIHGLYFEVPFESSKYTAAVSVESLHHFTEKQKRLLYQKLVQALAADGYFILTDYFAETRDLEKEYFDNLKRLKQELNIVDDAFYHYDTPLTVEHEMEILGSVGFAKG